MGFLVAIGIIYVLYIILKIFWSLIFDFIFKNKH